MPAPRRSIVTLAPLAAALIALGCVAAPDGRPAPRGAGEPTVTRTTDADGAGPDGTDSPEELAGDVEAARRLAEEYWSAEFRSAGLRFQPVAEVIPYERRREVDCGGQPLGLRNAAYCSAADFIA